MNIFRANPWSPSCETYHSLQGTFDWFGCERRLVFYVSIFVQSCDSRNVGWRSESVLATSSSLSGSDDVIQKYVVFLFHCVRYRVWPSPWFLRKNVVFFYAVYCSLEEIIDWIKRTRDNFLIVEKFVLENWPMKKMKK